MQEKTCIYCKKKYDYNNTYTHALPIHVVFTGLNFILPFNH